MALKNIGLDKRGHLRVLDYLIKTPNGKTIAVEVKSGNAIRNSSQLQKDNLIATEGGVLVGKNAPVNLRGKSLVFETIEKRIPR